MEWAEARRPDAAGGGQAGHGDPPQPVAVAAARRHTNLEPCRRRSLPTIRARAASAGGGGAPAGAAAALARGAVVRGRGRAHRRECVGYAGRAGGVNARGDASEDAKLENRRDRLPGSRRGGCKWCIKRS